MSSNDTTPQRMGEKLSEESESGSFLTPTSSDDESSARGRQTLTLQPPTCSPPSLITPPRSRSDERKHSIYSQNPESSSLGLEGDLTPHTISNRHQTATLMPELICEYSSSLEPRRYEVRHVVTTVYRKKKYNESKGFIHKILSGNVPASCTRMRQSLSESIANDLELKSMPKVIEGPEVDAEDCAVHIANKLIESTAPLFSDEQLLHALCIDCVKNHIYTLSGSVELLKEMHESIHYAHSRGNRWLSIQEYRQWKYLMNDLLCVGEIHDRMKRSCLNQFVIWVLVCRLAWNWRGADMFLMVLGRDLGGRLVVEWSEIEYEIEIGEVRDVEERCCNITERVFAEVGSTISFESLVE